MSSVAVVLLVKNGSRYLREVVASVQAQQTRHHVRVLAIDSGSTDASLEILSQRQVDTIRIPAAEFNHGDTRNLGVTLVGEDTDFVVFLTQDATPADGSWLANLVEPLVKDARVAGAFSRHIARPGSSPALVRQLNESWQTGQVRRIVKEMPEDRSAYERNRLYYVYFSDTSSAIRRSVWEDNPFPRTDFAEDAAWADRVLMAGYRIVFEPASKVIHSHDYPLLEQFRQNVDHAAGMGRLFPDSVDRSTRSWLRALGGIPKQVLTDVHYMRLPRYTLASPGQKLLWAVHSPFWHLASVAGTWLGLRLHSLRPEHRILVSRQERQRLGPRPRSR